jgi:hypothetical protein
MLYIWTHLNRPLSGLLEHVWRQLYMNSPELLLLRPLAATGTAGGPLRRSHQQPPSSPTDRRCRCRRCYCGQQRLRQLLHLRLLAVEDLLLFADDTLDLES